MAATTLTLTDMVIRRKGRHISRMARVPAIPSTADWHDFFTGLNWVHMASLGATTTATDKNIIVPNVKNDDTAAPGWCKIKTTVINTQGLLEVDGR